MDYLIKQNVKALSLVEYDLQTQDELVVNLGHAHKKDKLAREKLIGNSSFCKPSSSLADEQETSQSSSEELKVKECSLNPFLEKSKLQDLKNITFRNISEDFDARRNLDFIGLSSIAEKSA